MTPHAIQIAMNEEPMQMTDGPSTDVVFDVLGHPHRQALLYCLKKHDRSLPLADAAEQVAEKLDDRPIPEIPADEVKNIYLILYHSHVPKLGDEGMVEYKQELDMVSLTDRGEKLAEAMDSLDF